MDFSVSVILDIFFGKRLDTMDLIPIITIALDTLDTEHLNSLLFRIDVILGAP